jgi:uncharacterized repeat protein (TIGR02543 family)
MIGILNKKLIRYSLTIIVSVTMLFSCTLSAFAGEGASVIPAQGASIITAQTSSVIPAQAGISNEDSAALASLIIEPEPGVDYDGYIVKLDDSKSAQKHIDFDAAEELSEKVIDDNYVLVNEPEDVLEFADLNAVDLIEPNYLVSIAETFPDIDPNDPKYSSNQWDLPWIGAPDLWKKELRGSDSGSNAIKIAIIDTGINTTHEDINPTNIIFGKNYSTSYDSNADNYVDDAGHGSFVAGIIAAQTNNSKGIAGIADEAELIVLKILNGSGGGNTSAILAALNDLNDGTAPLPDVINMSVGWQGGSESINAVIQSLLDKGVIIVAAAGNDGVVSSKTTPEQVNQISYPAAYDGVIGVGATDSSDNIASYSTKNSTVDVSAPGSDMTSISKGTAIAYGSGSGTSYASPVVAAVAVAMKDFADDSGGWIDGDDFLSILTDTSVELGDSGKDTSYGVGRLDCNAITAYLLSYMPPSIATVSFDANGGNTLISTKYKAIGKSIGILPTATRTGYDFDGWWTQEIGGTQINESTTVTENVTYYAHWTPLPYDVTFDANGGVASDTLISKSYNDVIGTLPTATRPGHTFDGWWTEEIGGTQIDESTTVTDNIIYYAHWIRNYYTATFDANEGVMETTSVSQLYGDAIGTLPTATRTGHTFDGWHTAANGGSKISSETVLLNNVTYYAHWNKNNDIDDPIQEEEPTDPTELAAPTEPTVPTVPTTSADTTAQTNKYTVNFNSVGGNAISAKTISHASAVGSLMSPKRTGYKFLGWYTKASAGSKISTSTIIKKDITYYAHWVRVYTVKWNSKGGKLKVASKSVTKSAKVGKLQTPKRSGYKFLGWYTKASGGSKITKKTKIRGNKTYYAHWKRK